MGTELFYTGLFYFFSAIAVGSAGMVAFSRNLAHAIFMLLFALGAVAALYGMLGADFLFAAQILIYVGGILVILIFALMISDQFPLEKEIPSVDKSIAGITISLLFLGIMLMVAWGTNWPDAASIATEPTTALLGNALLTKYVFAFEIAGFVLLMALVGATLMTRQAETPAHENIEYDRERDVT